MNNSEKVIVSRNRDVKKLLVELGILSQDVEEFQMLTPEDAEGRQVYFFGKLPLFIAARAKTVSEVSVRMPTDKKFSDLNLTELKQNFRGIKTYKITQIE